MEKYEFLSLCRQYNGLTFKTKWFVVIHDSSLLEALARMPFIRKDNGGLIIDSPADALMAFSAMGFELKSTTLCNEKSFTIENFYFQRKIN